MDKAKNALLNEYKGYLFEFLVTKELRRMYKLSAIEAVLRESDFEMLSQQESFVRNQFPDLLVKLPDLAKATAESIFNNIKDIDVNNVIIVGKQNTSLQDHSFSEEDIRIEGCDVNLSISLKLAKYGIATNTKSSGVLSFFEKNFSNPEMQNEFNQFIDLRFEEMARDLHEITEIDYQPGFKNWRINKLPELPGQLNPEASERLKQYYEVIAQKLCENIKKLSVKENFTDALLPLTGLSQKDLVQVVCYYQKEYELKEVKIKSNQNLGKLKNIEHKRSSVILTLDQLELHLRIKPMNLFTTKAYKINSAVNFRPQA